MNNRNLIGLGDSQPLKIQNGIEKIEIKVTTSPVGRVERQEKIKGYSMSQVMLNLYVDNESKGPIPLKLVSDNANSILNAIKEELFTLKRNNNLPQNTILDKTFVIPKPGMFDFFSKTERVDIKPLTEDVLKKISVEPNIDVYFSTQRGGRRKRKSRKTRKNKRV